MIIRFILYCIILFSLNLANDKEFSDSLKTIYYDSKAPLLISTLPFLNKDPMMLFALTSIPLLLERDTLSTIDPDPNTALLLSSLPLLNLVSSNEIAYIPSLGQIYNKKHLKAFIMMAMKSYWLTEYHRSKDSDIKDRNRSLWWLLILILYGMADAYVDAQLDKKPENIVIKNDKQGAK